MSKEDYMKKIVNNEYFEKANSIIEKLPDCDEHRENKCIYFCNDENCKF
jgi:hypothetical protein